MPTLCANAWCKTPFETTAKDREMLAKFDIQNDPTRCPFCRHLERGLFYPRLRLHRRTSALSGQPIISIYHPDNRFPVYAVKEWWSDAWDGISYGRRVDFSRPFFPQFAELLDVVPRMAMRNENTENCEFSYSSGMAKNVYYSETVYRSEDVYYSKNVTGYCQTMCDCLRCFRSSYLHQCVQCRQCHYSSYLYRCTDTRDSHFCADCKSCTDCLFCWNLRGKSFHIFNKPVSKEVFETAKRKLLDGKFSTLQRSLDEWKQIRAKTIWRALYQDNCENSTGDALMNCANCVECYNCINCVDGRYCCNLSPSEKCTTSMDLTSGGIGELLYYSMGLGGGNYFIRFSGNCRLSSHLTYCFECYSCKNCFGCTGLRNKEYCVFNTQYSKEDYEQVAAQLTAHMKKTGASGEREWGKFFPQELCSFAYNESICMYFHPLEKEEILRRGWRWREPPPLHTDDVDHGEALPDSIDEVKDDICSKALTCAETGRKYKIVPQELALYRQFRIPLPRVHPDVRIEGRERMLNPYRLWDRACAKCGKKVQSSYAPNRTEIVYCEECYLATVY